MFSTETIYTICIRMRDRNKCLPIQSSIKENNTHKKIKSKIITKMPANMHAFILFTGFTHRLIAIALEIKLLVTFVTIHVHILVYL